MPIVKIPKGWEMAERDATPEDVALNRRKFLASLGAAALSAMAARPAWAGGLLGGPSGDAGPGGLYPAKRNPAYHVDRDLTEEYYATHYNNFAEFSDQKNVWRFIDRFQPEPWTINVYGLVSKPQKLDLFKLIRQMPLEERLYRMRCVEGWSIAVPWTGFPFQALMNLVQPTADARYVKFVSFLRPDEAPEQKAHPAETWPRFQGLSIPEAMNELTILATGIYGHELPKQSGAPIRLVVPWKYGFKSIKSIAAIEFTAQQPQAFWNNIAMPPAHFVANVNPGERYLDRSQSRERIIGTWRVQPTLLYNGYGEYVAKLYEKTS